MPGRDSGRRHILRLVCLYAALMMPHCAGANGASLPKAVIELTPPGEQTDAAAPPGERASSAFARLLHGVFAKAGSVKTAKGILASFPACESGEQEMTDAKTHEDWVAVIHFPPPLQTNDSMTNGLDCLLVLDRVKKAMLFGASAIIILTMNPNILKELDIAQLCTTPVIIVEDAGNITVLLKVIRSGLKLKVKITYGPSFYGIQTFTIWSACWRARPGSGVVCASDSRLSKVNPGLFWSYFYSALAVVMLLLLIKANRLQNGNADDEMDEETMGAVAWEALSYMKIKRYRKTVCNYDDSERDTCAICLDKFYRRQKIRILPCVHEFHMKCVDTWLLHRPICPLCKLNVLEAQRFGGFLQQTPSLVPAW